jgi:sugar O-acyltransferase (sialic acid O-acetyltransferase NeuD family)
MSEPIELVLIAGGGHATEVFSYVADLRAAGDPVNVLGVIDDGISPGDWEATRVLGGFDVLGSLVLQRAVPVHYLTCLGSNAIRKKMVARIEALGTRLVPWTLRHPTSQVGRSVEIGAGTLLAPGVIVTTRCTIGRHCIVNAKASIHHDCLIGDFVNINPGATVCGTARIAQGVYLGAGATVINGKSIGENSIIGAGAVVTTDIPANVTAVGMPARVIKTHVKERLA